MAIAGEQRRSLPPVSRETVFLPWLLVLTYSASLLTVGSALRVQHGFPLDDSYIHQTVARNLARYNVLGFIPGIPSSGATSVLWTYIQAFNYKFLNVDPVIFNLAISWMLLAIIGVFLFILAQRDGLPPLLSLAFAITPAFCGNFMWLALIGMEHLLFITMVLGCIYFWLEKQTMPYALLTGLCVGLLALIRPEAMVFGVVLAIIGVISKRASKEILAMLLVWTAFIAILIAANLYTSHSVMPATLKGRTWLYFHLTGGPHSFQSISSFLLGWVGRLRLQFSIWNPDPSFIILWLLPPLILVTSGIVWLLSQGGSRIRLLLLFASAHFLVFLLQLPSAGQGGRYQPLNLLLLFPCIFFGLLSLFERAMKRSRLFAMRATCLLLIAAGLASLRTWRTVSMIGIAHVNNTHAKAAQWLLKNVNPKMKIAAFDIGRISYDWNHPIIDLGGLVDPSYTPYLQNHQVPAYIEKQHVDYMILPSGEFVRDLGFSNSLSIAKIAEFCSPPGSWSIAWNYTLNAAQCQIVYQVR